MNNKLRQLFTWVIAFICILCVQVSVSAIDIGNIKDNLNLDAVLDLINQVTSQNADNISQNAGNITVTVTFKMGDVNLDGTVSTADARLALRASANLDVLDDISFKTSDVDTDGKITSKDARSILRYSIGLSKGF